MQESSALNYSGPLIPATLLRRYKRFLADVELADGNRTTVHCPNTGSMLGCDKPGLPVWISESANPRRKYRHTWELVDIEGTLVGINTGRANPLVREAIEAGGVPELGIVDSIRSEVRFGREGSRVDLLVESAGHLTYLEVKSVTASLHRGVALFPDAVTGRGRRHLRELIGVADAGHSALLVFCVQRGDVAEVRPADQIDPEYGATLRLAIDAGVKVIALQAQVTPTSTRLTGRIQVVCPELITPPGDSRAD